MKLEAAAEIIALTGEMTPINVNQSIKQIIKDAAKMITQHTCVVSRGALIEELKSHMSVREQGNFFFDIRQALVEMVEDGTLKAVTASRANGQTQQLLMLPDVVLAGSEKESN